jgi:hypothetical protein
MKVEADQQEAGECLLGLVERGEITEAAARGIAATHRLQLPDIGHR